MHRIFRTVRLETGASSYALREILWPHRQETLEHIRNRPGLSIFLYQSRYHDLLSLKYGAWSRNCIIDQGI
jgi:hypothetical protein